MSAKQMGLVFDHQFTRNQYPVALALADHADHEGCNMYPSVARLAWKTGYSERQVRYVLKELRRVGFLVRTAKSSVHKAVTYRFDWSKVQPKEPFRGAEFAPPIYGEDEKMHDFAPLDLQNTTERGAIAIAPEPSLIKTIHKPSKGNDTQPPKPELVYVDLEDEGGFKKTRKKRDPSLAASSIKIYRTLTGLQPPPSWREKVSETIGDDPQQITKWHDLIVEWIGRGWNPRNISGMLEAFSNGGIKGRVVDTQSRLEGRLDRLVKNGD